MQAYTDPSRESDPHAMPDIFAIRVDGGLEGLILLENLGPDCFPGCLPDSDPVGPFDSAEAALADARSYLDDSDA